MPETTPETPRAPERTRRRRRRIVLLTVVVVLIAVAVNAYLAVRPARVRALVQAALDRIIDGEVRFSDRIDVDWGDGIVLHHLVVAPPGATAGESLLRARRVVLKPDFGALFLGRFRISQLELRSPVISLSRPAGGVWNFERILAEGGGSWTERIAALRAIRVDSGALHYFDEYRTGAPVREDLTELSAVIESHDGAIRFSGTSRTPFLNGLQLAGQVDRVERSVEITFSAKRFNVTGELARLLGEEADAIHRDLQLHGFVDVEGGFQFDLERGLTPVAISGRLLECTLQPPRVPFPLERVSGNFRIEGRRIVVDGVEGKFGNGPFKCTGAIEWAPDWSAVTALQVEGSAESVPIDSRFRVWLPEHLVDDFDRLGCRGTVGMDLELQSESMPVSWEDVDLVLRIEDVEWMHRSVPYRFERTAGRVEVRDGAFEIQQPIVAHHGDVELVITGEGQVRADGDVDLRLAVDRLPLDAAVRNALPPRGVMEWDTFHPDGAVRVDISVRREGGEADVSAVVESLGASVRYEWFPYRISEIGGELIFDYARRRVWLREIHGYHEGNLITASGHFDLGEEESSEVRLAGHVALDSDLLAALPQAYRQLLDEFKPQDVIGAVTAKVSRVPGRGRVVDVVIDLENARMSFAHFPYPLHFDGGRIRCRGARSFTFRDLRLARGDGPAGTISGELSTMGAQRLLEYTVDVSDLAVDGVLRAALPDHLRRLVDGLGLTGVFQLELVGAYSYSVNQPSASRAQYHARNVGVSDGSVSFGVAIRDLHGDGEFIGKKDLDGGHTLTGVVQLDRARFNRLQFGETRMIFAHGREHVGIDLARLGRVVEGTDFMPSPAVRERLGDDRIADTFQVQVLRSDLYGGTLGGFLWVDVGEQNDFGGEYVAAGVQVPRAARDVFGVEGEKLAGKARGFVQFTGTRGSPDSIQGAGEGFVEDAMLLELPLFVSLVGLIFLKPTANPHFNQVDMKFEVRQGKFWAPGPDGLLVRGDSVNLHGAGSMGFDGSLDVALTPHFLDFRIPVIDYVLDLIKKTFVQVLVDGTLEKPRVRLGTAAGILKVPVGGGKRDS